MTDTVSPQTRSRMMSQIRSTETSPERRVRSYLHRQGLRFRKNVAGLPGRPDVVLQRHSTAVFVHGCFWHQHAGCRDGRIPRNYRHIANAASRSRIEAVCRNEGFEPVIICSPDELMEYDHDTG